MGKLERWVAKLERWLTKLERYVGKLNRCVDRYLWVAMLLAHPAAKQLSWVGIQKSLKYCYRTTLQIAME